MKAKQKQNFETGFVWRMQFFQAEIDAMYGDVLMTLSTITIDSRVEMVFKQQSICGIDSWNWTRLYFSLENNKTEPV